MVKLLLFADHNETVFYKKLDKRVQSHREKFMDKLIDDFIEMNLGGKILELCEEYYAEDLHMTSNGDLFASSKSEAYDKQKPFVENIREFDVSLKYKEIADNMATLVFSYKMTTKELKQICFTGKHIQTWKEGRIIREAFETLR